MFYKKFKSKNLELSDDVKRKYEIENPIDWIEGRCCICKFPLEINPTNFNATKEQMPYADFVIFKEHQFLRNIFQSESCQQIHQKTWNNITNALKSF